MKSTRVKAAIVLIFLSCAWLLGAIAFDAAASVGVTANPQTLSLTTANIANRVILLFFESVENPTVTTGGDTLNAVPTYNGVNSTVIATAFTDNTTFGIRSEDHYLVAPATGANNCSWSLTAMVQFDAVACITINGATQTSPVRTPSRSTLNDSTGAASASVNCTTVSGDIVVGVLAMYSAAASWPAVTPGGGITVQTSAADANGVKIHVSTQTASGTTTTTSFTWTGNRDYSVSCYPVIPVVTATGTSSGFPLLGVKD